MYTYAFKCKLLDWSPNASFSKNAVSRANFLFHILLLSRAVESLRSRPYHEFLPTVYTHIHLTAHTLDSSLNALVAFKCIRVRFIFEFVYLENEAFDTIFLLYVFVFQTLISLHGVHVSISRDNRHLVHATRGSERVERVARRGCENLPKSTVNLPSVHEGRDGATRFLRYTSGSVYSALDWTQHARGSKKKRVEVLSSTRGSYVVNPSPCFFCFFFFLLLFLFDERLLVSPGIVGMSRWVARLARN